MKQKRWLAIVLAVAIFVFSFISIDMLTGIVSAIQGDKEAATILLDKFQNQQSNLTEQVMNKGDSKKRIVLLNIDGTIVNDNQSVTNSYRHEEFLTELEAIKKDKTIQGVLLVINSPGGGAYESDQVRERFIEIQNKLSIPIYVSMKSIATGGGYFIATSGNKLFASSETITGFIRSTIKTTSNPNKEVLQKITNDSYNRFIDVVSEGRNIPKNQMEPLAGGRIFDGEEAKKLGLIDEIGNEQDALTALKHDYHLEESEVFVYQKPGPDLYHMIADKIVAIVQPKSEKSQPIGFDNSPRMMYLYGGE